MYKTKNQLSEEKKKRNCQKYKQLEVKQYVTKQWRGLWRNQRQYKKYLQTNENGNKMTQYVWDSTKAILREKFIVIQAYLRKKEKSQISNLI